MPTAATQQPSGNSQTRNGNKEQQVRPTVPFIRASAKHREPTGNDVSKLLTTSDQDLGVMDIPAYGYVRNLVILVTASGGTGGAPAATFTQNGILAALKNIYLTEPNGAVIAQFDTAYELYLANKFGGYGHVLGADPKASPVYSEGTEANFDSFSFLLRIPVELNCRDGLGSLPNQNAAATFKLRMTLAKVADIATGTLPTTLPTVRVRVGLEAWDQPEISSQGASNQITPPAMNTTQFWSSQSYTVNSGNNTIRLTRVGNYIRNLIFVLEDGSVRADGETIWNAADPVYFYLDTRPLDIIEPNSWLETMYNRSGYGATVGTEAPAQDAPRGLEDGVRVYDFCHEFDGTYGHENRDLWLPTLGSTRLELQFNASAAGTLKVLTNDVAIAGSVFI